MAEDSVQNENSFYLKPGGVREEGLATDLPADTYSQAHGVEQQGVFQRTPGKQLFTQYTDKVLQIAGFGGALFIQHGPNLIMYPDACAVAPTAEQYVAPPVVVPPADGRWVIDLPNSIIANTANSRLTRVTVSLYDGGTSDSMTTLQTWNEAQLVAEGNTGVFDLPAADYNPLDYTAVVTSQGLIGTLFYLLYTCEFTDNTGAVTTYSGYPLQGSGFQFTGATPTDGAALSQEFISGGLGTVEGVCIYANCTAFTLPVAFPDSAKPAPVFNFGG